MGELLHRCRWPIATHDMATRVPVKRQLTCPVVIGALVGTEPDH